MQGVWVIHNTGSCSDIIILELSEPIEIVKKMWDLTWYPCIIGTNISCFFQIRCHLKKKNHNMITLGKTVGRLHTCSSWYNVLRGWGIFLAQATTCYLYISKLYLLSKATTETQGCPLSYFVWKNVPVEQNIAISYLQKTTQYNNTLQYIAILLLCLKAAQTLF